MADASSCDTTSDCCNESYSDMSEKYKCRIIGQVLERTSHYRSRKHFLNKLFTREIRGSTALHSYAPEERLMTFIPSWRCLPISRVIPKSALEAGHIFLGLTQCGKFLLTYTNSCVLSSENGHYKYLLHWWAFTQNEIARKVAEVSLFGNYSIYRDLNITIAQWPNERNKLVIHGLCSMMTYFSLQRVDRAYLTITTVPSLDNCKDCLKIAASYEEEELAANWDNGVRCNCLQHGLTVHTTYDLISPYPRFQAKVSLNYSNHVVINTGNFLHVFKVDLEMSRNKNAKSNDKQDISFGDVPLDVFDETEAKVEGYDGTVSPSPKCDSSTESDIIDEFNRQDTSDDMNMSIFNGCQNDYICDNNKSNDSLSMRACDCTEQVQDCNCKNPTVTQKDNIKSLARSVRDEILQDFCEELNIGSDTITLVKHRSCSPRSTPQRLPVDLKPQSWLVPNLMPPSYIFKTSNSEYSHPTAFQQQNSPEPGASQEQRNCSNSSQDSIAINSISTINSLHSLSISPSPSSSSRLMSPPISTSFRHLTSRRRNNLQSPPPNLSSNQQMRTRSSYKLIQEAEKAYEFTDDTQEITCEKLSSFRKRRLADKKYEFCDETEDAENIVPFKHIRDQAKCHDSSFHQIDSPTTSPIISITRRHRVDSDQSENEDCNVKQDSSLMTESDSAEKSVLRPLNQNQLSNGNVYRDRLCKYSSQLVPKANLQYPSIKCTAHYKRSYIELDDEMVSVITEVEDEETGGYVSYQYVLPMVVHGSGYTQMQMISNSKVEKMTVPCVRINQRSFDIEMFSHHIADWICNKYNKNYWHCSDYDIEIIQICALSGDIICLLMLKIQASDIYGQNQCSQERKQYEGGCEFTWNIETSEYRIMKILPLNEMKSKSMKQVQTLTESVQKPWNPTSSKAASLREKIKQPYAHMVRYLETDMAVTADSLVSLIDVDNLVEFHNSVDFN